MSENLYQALFCSISESFALHEIILDENGDPCDYRYLEVNPAFEAATGIPRERWIGHTVLEVIPDLEHIWIETGGRVALTGESARFEGYVAALDRHYAVLAFSPKPMQFASLAVDITERRKAEQELKLKNAMLSIQQEASPDGIMVVGANKKVVFYNQRFVDILGIEREVMDAESYVPLARAVSEKLADPEAFQNRIQHIQNHTEEEVSRDEIALRDGRIIDRYTAPMLGADGEYLGRIWQVRDITEAKRSESQIRLHSAALNAADDLIAIMDDAGRIVFANDAFRKQTGCRSEELIGLDLAAMWPETPAGVPLRQVWDPTASCCGWSGEMLCKSSDGGGCTADVSITPLLTDDGVAAHWVAIARNITERKVHEGLLDYQAHHDALTDLPNRVKFSEELAATVSDRRERRQQCAVLFVDLDRFKLVNDTMGHHAGDCLLVEVALRLGSCLRAGDVLARIGGDEFIALLKNIKSTQDAGSVANRMLQQMSSPFDIRGSRLVIGASIGISVFPDNATDAETLIKFADAAMYRAKELGRNNRQFYSKQLNETNKARVDMEGDLRRAMSREELKVYYQPIIEAKTMRLAGAEALLRWDHPEKGAISPGLFVPIAEETGLIVQIGRSVLESACRQAQSWREQGMEDFQVSVNVSAVQLRSSNFGADVLRILSATGLPPKCLNLEVVESALDRNDYGEMKTLVALKDAGVSVCLDDYGLGYSSLSKLKELPIVSMKVDGSFIKDIGHSQKDRAMTESIISMAHSLDIRVTAEWIESEEQMATIQSLDCDYAQGYFISPALTAGAFHDFITDWARRCKKAA